MIIADGSALACQPVGNGTAKLRVGNPVGRVGDDRGKTTGQFVFALGAAFETLQPMLDGVFDSAVIAQLEMQAVDALQRTPVTAIERAAVLQAPAGGNRLISPAGDEQNAVTGQ
ncbi:hypothetical protein VI06_20425 [Aquitalea magnusonii]|nr:hypothetical protein VI06_20425 [Aquitalea magnusonii]